MREPSGVDARPQLPVRAPASDARVSAILLSWRRPNNIERIVAELRTWKRIGEIFVWNNNPDRKLSLPGATIIDSGRNFGCLARYGMVPLAENQALGIAIMSYNGQLNFGLNADYDALPDLEALADELSASLQELVAAAGAAPADAARGRGGRAVRSAE